ncbi:MAG: hypothetical protein IPP29_20785 [Bacteroidetes bacterium]|nr:hypothetical protein [Bacteroidota bacterium]
MEPDCRHVYSNSNRLNGCIATNNIVVTQPAVLDTISTSSTAAKCGACVEQAGTGNNRRYVTIHTPTYGAMAIQCNSQAYVEGNNFSGDRCNGCTTTVCVKVNSTGGFASEPQQPDLCREDGNIRWAVENLMGAINLTTNPQGAYVSVHGANGASTEDLFGVGAGTYDVIVSYGTCTRQ